MGGLRESMNTLKLYAKHVCANGHVSGHRDHAFHYIIKGKEVFH